MIARITGIVAELADGSAIVEHQGIGYEVLVPGYALAELAAAHGREVTLHTLEFYEASPAGGHLAPRLVGFTRPQDRHFFERFITVKGVGIRKALRALTAPAGAVAAAIQAGDVDMLASLPGIGRRAAAQIVAELRGKMDSFATGPTRQLVTEPRRWTEQQRLALRILIDWGDPRSEAERWLQRAAELHPGLETAEQWVQAAYRIKSGLEG